MARTTKTYKKLAPSEKGSTEAFLIKYAKTHDGECFKLTFITGIPDRLLILPGGLVFFFETKSASAGKKGLSVLQKWWLQRLRNLGFIAECVKNSQEALEIIEKVRYESIDTRTRTTR